MFKTLLYQEIEAGLRLWLMKIVTDSRRELREQGHYVTGETEKSFKIEIERVGNVFTAIIWVKTSAIILNYGVSASRVPFGGRGGRGGKSKYIQALLNWAAYVKPQLDEKERKRFVFAVANKAKKEGHPTKGSYEFSENGRRKEWINYSIQIGVADIFKFIDVRRVLAQSFKAALS